MTPLSCGGSPLAFAKTAIALVCTIVILTSMLLDIQSMSREQKLMAMHELWEDLEREDHAIASPEWRGEALADAAARLAQGTERIHDWDTAKAELRRRASGSAYGS